MKALMLLLLLLLHSFFSFATPFGSSRSKLHNLDALQIGGADQESRGAGDPQGKDQKDRNLGDHNPTTW